MLPPCTISAARLSAVIPVTESVMVESRTESVVRGLVVSSPSTFSPPYLSVAPTNVAVAPGPRSVTPPPGTMPGPGWHGLPTEQRGTPTLSSSVEVNTLPGAEASTLPPPTAMSPFTMDCAGNVTVPGPRTFKFWLSYPSACCDDEFVGVTHVNPPSTNPES